MSQQILICIDREFGSGGRDIAHMLGDLFDIPVYHHSLLKRIGIHESYDMDEVRDEFDEAPRIKFMSRTVKGMTNSNSDHIANEEFKLLQQMAKDGKSFIVIGHCAEYVLKPYGVMSMFISGDKEMRIERTMDSFHETRKEAKKRMKRMDRNRKSYHNHYCTDHRWGDAKYYDICMNSTRLGVADTAAFLSSYIRARLEKEQRQQG